MSKGFAGAANIPVPCGDYVPHYRSFAAGLRSARKTTRLDAVEIESYLQRGTNGTGHASEPRRLAANFPLGAAVTLGVLLTVFTGIVLGFLERPREDSTLQSQPLIPAVAARRASSPESAKAFVAAPGPDARSVKPRPRIARRRIEARVRRILARSGFRTIGVSVGKSGDVFLAGTVYTRGEVRHVMRLARRVRGVSSVHFMHPDYRTPRGPGYLGVTASGAPDVSGAKVMQVEAGSPADKAGIRPGDIITVFGRKTVPGAGELRRLLNAGAPGERITLRFRRDGRRLVRVVRLTEPLVLADR